MRIYDPATLSMMTGRGGIIARRMVWIEARNRETGLPETLGLWAGEDDIATVVEGQLRTYLGVAGLMQGEPITAGTGLSVRVHQLRLAAIDRRVEDLVKGYDTRFAPVEIHRAILDPETQALQGAPHRIFRGLVNSIDFPEAEPGADPMCTVEVVSETRLLTRTLALKKSDESQRARGDDRLRRYGDISGVVPVYWGELYAAAPADPAPVANKSGSNANTDQFGNIIYAGR